MQDQLIHFGKKALPYLAKYQYLLIGAAVIGVFVFAVFRIDTELRTERDEESYSTQLLEVQTVNFDAEAAERIRGLENTGAEIQAEVEENRTNPFQ